MTGINPGLARPQALVVIVLALLLIFTSQAIWAAGGEAEHESPVLGTVSYIVYSPSVEAGERAIDIRGWRQFDGDDELDGSGVLKLAVETTVTDFWLIAPYLEFAKEGEEGLLLEAVEIENIFQLTPPGKYWLDVGFLVEGMFNVNGHDVQKLRYGLLLEKELGHMVATANLLLENQFGADAEHHEGETFFSYALNIRYLLSHHLELGVSAYGGVGALGEPEDGSDQVHQIGPSIQGELELVPGRGAIKYRTEVVFGLTSGSPDATWVAEFEYEF